MRNIARAGGDKPSLDPLPCSPEQQQYRERCRSVRVGLKSPNNAKLSPRYIKLIDRVRSRLMDQPCVYKDMIDAMGCDREEARKIVNHLSRSGQIVCGDLRKWRLQETVTA